MELDLAELTLVGFEGVIEKVECGRALPLYYQQKKRRYFIPSAVSEPLIATAWFSPAEVETYLAERRWTRFATPVPAFPKAVVLYVTEELLQALSQDLPALFRWQPVEGVAAPAWVTCAAAEAVEAQLDAWGQALMDAGDRLFAQFLDGKRHDQALRERVESTLKLARNAARSPHLREQIFVRYGAVRMYCEEAQALREMFNLLQLSYPDWTWAELQQRIDQYITASKPQPRAVAAAAVGQAAWSTNGHDAQAPAQVEASLLRKVRRDADASHVELTQAEGRLLLQELELPWAGMLRHEGKGYGLYLIDFLRQKRASVRALGRVGQALRNMLIET